MNSFKRLIVFAGAFAVTAAVFVGCGLEYTGEEFSLKIGKNGSGKLTVLYKNFGSKETKSHTRKNDLDRLHEAVKSDKTVIDAMKKGVTLKNRRLDFIDYKLNGYVEAEAASYKDLFKVFTNYTLEVGDRIIITPHNGAVTRATLSDGGEIIIRNNRYAFAWPLTATDISFEARYQITGASFSYEFQKQNLSR